MTGLAGAVRHHRLVLADWLVGVAAFGPPALVVDRLLAPVLGRLPDAIGSLPPGELALITRSALEGHGEVLAGLTAGGIAALLVWSVLWRSGVGAWTVWRRGRAPRLAHLLGLGLVGWWRMAGVVVAGLVFVGLALAAIAALTAVAATWSLFRGSEMVLVGSVLAGCAAAVAALGLGRAATLAAAWRAVRPDRPPVLWAWLGGLGVALRHPLAATVALLLWDGAAAAALGLALLVLDPGAAVAGRVPALVAVAAASLVRAFSRVALHLSFEPAAGLRDPARADHPSEAAPESR